MVPNNQSYIFKKYIAAFIDYAIVITIIYYMIRLLGEPVNNGEDTYQLTGFPVLLTILPWLIFVVCTEYFFGSTLGNGIIGLKPVPQRNIDGKITFLQSFQRHLLDWIDMFFFGVVGIIIMENNNGQRLGDIWAKTVVVTYSR